ncbi:MAG: hypothetical protein D6826_00705 [Alphaproteobacteria bacterium]|nr:MAG: hypothetical protein D6826_00705 [Alphaproteobacteria bacterium]
MQALPVVQQEDIIMLGKTSLSGILVFAALAASPIGAAAETAMQKALEAGARQLSADEIAHLLVGKTVTARSGDKRFLFYYGTDNVLSGKLIGGDWSDTGYYGITDDDRVCLSITKDKGRLRCVTLLILDGAVKKYDVNGKMTFELLDFQVGNHM